MVYIGKGAPIMQTARTGKTSMIRNKPQFILVDSRCKNIDIVTPMISPYFKKTFVYFEDRFHPDPSDTIKYLFIERQIDR